jgi:hypothetical protein
MPRDLAELTKPLKWPTPGTIAIDDRIICDAPDGVFRRCDRCGGTLFRAALGQGPHLAQLICMTCDRRGRWLGIRHLKREKRVNSQRK